MVGIAAPCQPRHDLVCPERKIKFQPLRINTNNTSPVKGEDQHAYNTDKTALSGTRRHDYYYDLTGPVTNKDAGELG